MGSGAILTVPPGFSFAPPFFVPSACRGSATGLWLGPFSTLLMDDLGTERDLCELRTASVESRDIRRAPKVLIYTEWLSYITY